jgi:RNA polymerase sigma-70 factor (ECF subfamily)
MDLENSAGRFPTTHWSEVARAGVADSQIKRDALGQVLKTYMPALRAHLLWKKRVGADRADDLLQGFICDQVIADNLIARADQGRGRFRAFVLTALNRYVARMARAEHAQMRKPSAPMVSLSDHDPVAGTDSADPFDLAWAREIVQLAIRKMRDQCTGPRYQEMWLVFESCTLTPLLNGTEPPTHHQVMNQSGLASPQEVSNTLVTAKRMFARVLRAVVGEYACDQAEIEAELIDLYAILSRNVSSSPNLPSHHRQAE